MRVILNIRNMEKQQKQGRSGKADRPHPNENNRPLRTTKAKQGRSRQQVVPFGQEVEAKRKQEELVAMIETVNNSIDESARLFRASLYDSYLSQTLTDVTVQLDYDVFTCHGLILASATSFFDKKIRVEHCSYIRVSHVCLSGTVFKGILQFFYLGRFLSDVSLSIEDIAKGMAYLGLTPKFQKMLGLALSVMDTDLYIKHWTALCNANLTEAAATVLKAILRDFPKITPDDDFFKLKCQQIVDLMSADDLTIENEESVCDMALLWLDQNEVTEDETVLVFRAMRLSQVSSSYLGSYVETFELLDKYPVCKNIVAEARYFHQQPGRRHDYYDKRYSFRSASTLTETMVLFGGVKKDGSPGELMLAFNFSTQGWCSLGTFPITFGEKFAYCTFDNDIYVSGGSTKPPQVARYAAASVRWTKVNDLKVGRSGHCMEAVDHNIYVLGGVDVEGNLVSEVEELNVETGIWRSMTHLIFPLTDACSAVIKDKIYTFGGLLDLRSSNVTGLVQCFDPRTETITVIKDMAMVLNRPNAIKVNKSVYVIDSHGKVYEISEDHLTVTEIGSLPEFNRKKFGLYAHHGKLLVIGGETGDLIKDDMICFQPNTKQAILCPWTDLMPPVRSDFGIVKIVVEKNTLKEELNVRAL